MEIGNSYSKEEIASILGPTNSPFDYSVLEMRDETIIYIHLDPAKNLGVHVGVDHIVFCGMFGGNRMRDRERIKLDLHESPKPIFAKESGGPKPFTYLGEYLCIASKIGDHPFRGLSYWIINPDHPEDIEELLFLERVPSKDQIRKKNDQIIREATQGLEKYLHQK